MRVAERWGWARAGPRTGGREEQAGPAYLSASGAPEGEEASDGWDSVSGRGLGISVGHWAPEADCGNPALRGNRRPVPASWFPHPITTPPAGPGEVATRDCFPEHFSLIPFASHLCTDAQSWVRCLIHGPVMF